MEHLMSTWGGPVSGGGIEVPLLLKRSPHLEKVDEFFFKTSRENFRFSEFESFPKEGNWRVGKDDKLQEISSSQTMWTKNQILQAWLFFGLIAFVVREEKPLLDVYNLAPDRYQDYCPLRTNKLPESLQKWHDWLKQCKNKAELHGYLIEVDRALELARRVVRANFEAVQPNLEMEGIQPNGNTTSSPGGTHKGGGSRTDRDEYGYDRLNGTRVLELSLMVLGETLSAVQTHIMKDLGLTINGWFMDDDEGWGPPSFIFAKMESEGWCRRARTVLRGQLGASAILLYTAYANLKEDTNDRSTGNSHKGCTEEICYYTHKEKDKKTNKIKYMTAHHGPLCRPSEHNCSLQGPDMETVNDILGKTDWTTEAEEFPIFRIVSDLHTGRVRGVTVEKWNRQDMRGLRNPEFAAISHVWSQGMGNENANELWECQLQFIRQVLDSDSSGAHVNSSFKEDRIESVIKDAKSKNSHSEYSLSVPFWMDTLAIPVKDEAVMERTGLSPADITVRKKTAIRQIYHVFNSASRVFIIDKELWQKPGGGMITQSVIKILTSHWMRRLWTLQEAFLSQRLFIVYGKPDGSDTRAEDLDSYLSKPEGDHDSTKSIAFCLSLAELSKRKLYHNMMGEDRQIRNRKENPILSRGSMVIASAWRSSRWRNTSRSEDETLALSTLLNLDYRGTLIENASEHANLSEGERKLKRQGMMQDFWTLIHRTYEGSIPAGLIFLPGEKLTILGFGWAPTTWMSRTEESYPYPLTFVSKPTELRPEGLLVQYPGFLLHGGDPSLILATNHGDSRELVFPTERHLSEWYKAIVVDPPDLSPVANKILQRTKSNFTQGESTDDGQRSKPPSFGIILSRSKPGEWPEEIGLLVEVYHELWRTKEPERINKKIYCCQIIHRVRVCRVPKPSPKLPKLPKEANYSKKATKQDADENDWVLSGKPGHRPIGEAMPEDTLWCVDGHIDTRDAFGRPSTPTKIKNNDNADKPKANGGMSESVRTGHVESSRTTNHSRSSSFMMPRSTTSLMMPRSTTSPMMPKSTTSPTPDADADAPSKLSVVAEINGDSTHQVYQAEEERGIDSPLVTPTILRKWTGFASQVLQWIFGS